MNTRQLLSAFDDWRALQQDLVLATVYETSGSTYSKAGAQMLIDGDGIFQGMLSGGCLEGDLAVRAANVLANGEPQAVTFDLGSSDDELWGLGVGCDGLMRIFLQPLRADEAYEPFASMAKIYNGDDAGAVATVIASDDADTSPGATLLWHAGTQSSSGMSTALQRHLLPALMAKAKPADTMLLRESWNGADMEILMAFVSPPPRILVLGAGLDAQPLVRLINDLGWRATVQDHRPAYIEKGNFDGAERVLSARPETLATTIDLATYDAAIVMSHHLDTDRQYLELLATTQVRYIGLLGPPARRERLLQDLGETGRGLRERVRGPAGLDIGGRGPASIAVSIAAEMHQRLLADAG